MSYLLDDCGSCANDRDMFGDSTVQYAAYNGHMEAVKLLIEQHHADATFVNQLSTAWATAADDAETRGHPELAAYVRECGIKQCDEGDYNSISPQAADLSLAISNCQRRYLLFMHEKSLLHKAMNTSVGDLVTVHVASNPEVEAVVKYRGPLKDCVGIFFGVQLQDPVFNGATDGSYKGIQLFACPANCGLFLSIDNIVL